MNNDKIRCIRTYGGLLIIATVSENFGGLPGVEVSEPDSLNLTDPYTVHPYSESPTEIYLVPYAFGVEGGQKVKQPIPLNVEHVHIQYPPTTELLNEYLVETTKAFRKNST